MSSVTKNPLYLQSANYIYSWFLSRADNEKIKLFNGLETITSDYESINFLKKNKNKKNYEDFDSRYSKYFGDEK